MIAQTIGPVRVAEIREQRDLCEQAGRESGSSPDAHWAALEQAEQSFAVLAVGVWAGVHLVGWGVALIGAEFFGHRQSASTLSLFVQRPYRWRWGWRVVVALAGLAWDRGLLFRVNVVAGSRLDRQLRRRGFLPAVSTFEIAPGDPAMQYSAEHGPSRRADRSVGLPGHCHGAAARRGLEGPQAGAGRAE